MNAQDRKKIAALKERFGPVITELTALQEEFETLANDEQEKFDNMAEGLQASDQGQKIETAAGVLSNISQLLESARDAVDEAWATEVEE